MKYPIIAERINEIMQRQGISQRKLAKMSGLSELTIRNFQQGKHRPTRQSAFLMSKVLNVEPDYLTGEEYKQEEEPNQTKEIPKDLRSLEYITLNTFLELYFDNKTGRIIVLCRDDSREEMQEDFFGELQDGTLQISGDITSHIISAFLPGTPYSHRVYMSDKVLNSDVTGFSIGNAYIIVWLKWSI